MKRRVVLCVVILVLLLLVRFGVTWRTRQLVDRADAALVVFDDAELAEQESRRLLDWDQDHPQGLLIHGVALARQQRFDKALEYLNRIPADGPFRADAETAIAEALMHLHRYREAEEQLTKNLMRDPADDSARFLLFSLFLQTMRTEEAIHLYESRLTGAESDVPRLIELLDVLAGPVPARRRQLAITTYCKNLEHEPDALAALGRTSALLGEPAAAERYFRQAISAEPSNRRIQVWATDFFLSQGRDVPARAILERYPPPPASASPPERLRHADCLRLQAAIAAKDGDLQRALGLTSSSLLIHRSGLTLSLKSDLLRRLERTGEAEEAMAELAELGKADTQLVQLHAAVRSKPLTAEICSALSDTLRRLGRERQAEAWSKVRVPARNPPLSFVPSLSE